MSWVLRSDVSERCVCHLTAENYRYFTSKTSCWHAERHPHYWYFVQFSEQRDSLF